MLYFYQPNVTKGNHFLSDEEYKHCTKVLRKKVGDTIGVLDGQGFSGVGTITEITTKECRFELIEEKRISQKPFSSHVVLSPTKSIDRVEWFVEKACELGVDQISFIQTKNSERNKLRVDRLEKKAISALKQSKSGYLTQINPLTKFDQFIRLPDSSTSKYIAVVEPDLPYLFHEITPGKPITVLIGPEGDFTLEEVQKALASGYRKVSLGKNTLRTETAGVIAATMVNTSNRY